MDNLREKLIELIDGYEYPSSNPGLADHLIANGVTVQRWIPVSERLPEDDLPKGSKVNQIKALVAYMRNGYWVVRTNLRKKGMRYGKPDKWDWSVSDPITHWMPLPEPPKEEPE